MIKFGDFINKKRSAQNITQKQLADMLHVTSSAVSKWERNIAIPHVSLFPKIAQVLHFPVEELYALIQDNADECILSGQADTPDDTSFDSLEDLLPPINEKTDDEMVAPFSSKEKHARLTTRLVLTTALLGILVIVIMVFVRSVLQTSEPVFRVAEEYFTTEEPYFNYTDIYYVNIEYDGALTNEYLQVHEDSFFHDYTYLFDKAELVIISFYDKFDPDTSATPDFKMVLLPDNKGK